MQLYTLFPLRRHGLALLGLVLSGVTLEAQRQAPAPAFPPPAEVRAIPEYGGNRIFLLWKDRSRNETSYEVFRKAGAGPWEFVGSVPANSPGAVDSAVNTTTEYRYAVRGRNAVGASAFGNVARQNLKTLWPTPATHEILHGWNETIRTAAVDETEAVTGFHMGVDIERTGANQRVRAARGGRVHQVEGGPDGVVVIEVLDNTGSTFLQTNHIDTPVVVENQYVYAGQDLAKIDEGLFFGGSLDHTHYVRTNAAYQALPSHPLALFSSNADRDPQEQRPGPREQGAASDGTLFFRRPGAGEYLVVDELHPVHGDVEIIVEYGDEQGTDPDQVPTALGYWLDPWPALYKPPHGVKSGFTPYLLFRFDNAYFGDAPGALAVHDTVVDTDREVAVGTVWKNYKHFRLSATKGTDGAWGNVDATQHWNTDAKDDFAADTVAHANYAGKPDATKATEARFPDGDYVLNVLSLDLIHAEVDQTVVRIENYPPIVWDCDPFPGFVAPADTDFIPNAFVRFSEPMDIGISPALFVSIDNGATLSSLFWANEEEVRFDISGLMNGHTYTVTLSTVATDRPGTPGGNSIDGNQDGIGGDSFSWTFSIAP